MLEIWEWSPILVFLRSWTRLPSTAFLFARCFHRVEVAINIDLIPAEGCIKGRKIWRSSSRPVLTGMDRSIPNCQHHIHSLNRMFLPDMELSMPYWHSRASFPWTDFGP